jgi:hypothetical protein
MVIDVGALETLLIGAVILAIVLLILFVITNSDLKKAT